MEDYIILISIIQKEDKIEIVSYSSDFNSILPNEKEYCHKYMITLNQPQSIIVNTEVFPKNSCIHINQKTKEVNILNDWTGDEVSFTYDSLTEMEPPVEEILMEKISHLKQQYEIEYKNACTHRKKLRDIQQIVHKEIDSASRKIDFFKSQSNTEKSSSLIGKIELGNKLLEIIEKRNA